MADIADLMRTAANQLIQKEGVHPSLLESVKLARLSNPFPRQPMIYEPCIIIALQGQKVGYLGQEKYAYDAHNYLVMSLPIPFECEAFATPEEPYLAIVIGIDTMLLSDLLFEMDDYRKIDPAQVSGIHAFPVSDKIQSAAFRLVQALMSERDAKILGPQIVREIVYYVLSEEQGAGLRALAARHGHFSQIARIMKHIHANYAENIDIEALAMGANMSISSFHQHFKSVTLTSPLQYLKNVRLHKARILIVEEGKSAAAASIQVGYESPSQFNREFKRLFGNTPMEEASKHRKVSA